MISPYRAIWVRPSIPTKPDWVYIVSHIIKDLYILYFLADFTCLRYIYWNDGSTGTFGNWFVVIGIILPLAFAFQASVRWSYRSIRDEL